MVSFRERRKTLIIGSAFIAMRVITRKRLQEFWGSKLAYADAEKPLRAWFHEVNKANWKHSADAKAQYRNASIVGGSRVVFNIAGNKYRIVVEINYASQVVYIRFVGTHHQYDQIDAETVK